MLFDQRNIFAIPSGRYTSKTECHGQCFACSGYCTDCSCFCDTVNITAFLHLSNCLFVAFSQFFPFSVHSFSFLFCIHLFHAQKRSYILSTKYDQPVLLPFILTHIGAYILFFNQFWKDSEEGKTEMRKKRHSVKQWQSGYCPFHVHIFCSTIHICKLCTTQIKRHGKLHAISFSLLCSLCFTLSFSRYLLITTMHYRLFEPPCQEKYVYRNIQEARHTQYT